MRSWSPGREHQAPAQALPPPPPGLRKCDARCREHQAPAQALPPRSRRRSSRSPPCREHQAPAQALPPGVPVGTGCGTGLVASTKPPRRLFRLSAPGRLRAPGGVASTKPPRRLFRRDRHETGGSHHRAVASTKPPRRLFRFFEEAGQGPHCKLSRAPSPRAGSSARKHRRLGTQETASRAPSPRAGSSAWNAAPGDPGAARLSRAPSPRAGSSAAVVKEPETTTT